LKSSFFADGRKMYRYEWRYKKDKKESYLLPVYYISNSNKIT
jgi:hypothetical protein